MDITSDLLDDLLEKPYWVVDLLPEQVPPEGGGRYFALEDYYLEPKRLASLHGRFANLVLRLSAYVDVDAVAFGEDGELVPVAIPDAAALAQAVASCPDRAAEGGLDLVFSGGAQGEGPALLTIPGDVLNLTLYNPSAHLLCLMEALARAEGLFCWQPPTFARKLASFDGKVVRLRSGNLVFEGQAEWLPADYGLVEYDRQQEMLQIDDWVFFAEDIDDVEAIPAKEPPATYIWMNRVQHTIQVDGATFAALEAEKTDILSLSGDEVARRGIEPGHILRLVWADLRTGIDEEEVLRFLVGGCAPAESGTVVLQLQDLDEEGDE